MGGGAGGMDMASLMAQMQGGQGTSCGIYLLNFRLTFLGFSFL
jgi:hypothetical protein